MLKQDKVSVAANKNNPSPVASLLNQSLIVTEQEMKPQSAVANMLRETQTATEAMYATAPQDMRLGYTLGETFGAAAEAGAQQLEGDVKRFGAIRNLIKGDEEQAQKRLNQAEVLSQTSGKILGDLGEFSAFVDEPTVDGFFRQVIKGVGQFTPMAVSSIASGLAGGAVATIGKGVLSSASKKVTKDMMASIVKKHALAKAGKGAALNANEKAIMDSAYKAVRKAGQHVNYLKLAQAGQAANLGRPAAVKTIANLPAAQAGFWAGAFGQEYVVGSAQAAAEYQEAGYKLTKKEAAAALKLGIPQAILGTLGERLFVGALFKRAAKDFVKKGDKKFGRYMVELAKGFGGGLLQGGTQEGLTELGQEELLIRQRMALDPEYSQEEANLRRGESAFIGFWAGGARSAPTSAIANVLGLARSNVEQAKGMVKAFKEGKYTDAANLEDVASLTAQTKAMLNNGPKKAVFINATTVEERAGYWAAILAGLKKQGVIDDKTANKLEVIEDPDGKGFLIYDRSNSQSQAVKDDFLANGFSEEQLRKNLGMSYEQDASQVDAVVVRDKDGNELHAESIPTEDAFKAQEEAVRKSMEEEGIPSEQIEAYIDQSLAEEQNVLAKLEKRYAKQIAEEGYTVKQEVKEDLVDTRKKNREAEIRSFEGEENIDPETGETVDKVDPVLDEYGPGVTIQDAPGEKSVVTERLKSDERPGRERQEKQRLRREQKPALSWAQVASSTIIAAITDPKKQAAARRERANLELDFYDIIGPEERATWVSKTIEEFGMATTGRINSVPSEALQAFIKESNDNPEAVYTLELNENNEWGLTKEETMDSQSINTKIELPNIIQKAISSAFNLKRNPGESNKDFGRRIAERRKLVLEKRWSVKKPGENTKYQAVNISYLIDFAMQVNQEKRGLTTEYTLEAGYIADAFDTALDLLAEQGYKIHFAGKPLKQSDGWVNTPLYKHGNKAFSYSQAVTNRGEKLEPLRLSKWQAEALTKAGMDVKAGDPVPTSLELRELLETVPQQVVDGGTGWAVQMAIDAGKPVYVFDGGKWYVFEDGKFVETKRPDLTKDHAIIGTRTAQPKFTSPTTINIWSTDKNTFESLSNFAKRPFVGEDGKKYQSVEHAYQSWKTGEFNETVYNEFVRLGRVPSKAWLRKNSKGPKRDGDWNMRMMEQAMRASFNANPEAMALLKKTGNAKLTHKGGWDKHFEVEFPKLLEKIRGVSSKETFVNEAFNKQIRNQIAALYRGTDESYTNHSGGAIGVDMIGKELGEKKGVKQNHYYVEGHETPGGNVAITEEEAKTADPALEEANETLNRKINKKYAHLLQRNKWQVDNAEAVFAFAPLMDNSVYSTISRLLDQGLADRMEIEIEKTEIEKVLDDQGYLFAGLKIEPDTRRVMLDVPDGPAGALEAITKMNLRLRDEKRAKKQLGTPSVDVPTPPITLVHKPGSFKNLINKFNVFAKAIQENKLTKITGRKANPRQVVWFGAEDYKYTGAHHEAQDMPNVFSNLARQLEKELGYPEGYFNAVLANLYPEAADIGAHSDNEAIHRIVHPETGDITYGAVATISLGGTSEITITNAKTGKVENVITVKDGDLYVMPAGKFQIEKKHAVGKATEGKRIGITFRHIPEANIKDKKKAKVPPAPTPKVHVGSDINTVLKGLVPVLGGIVKQFFGRRNLTVLSLQQVLKDKGFLFPPGSVGKGFMEAGGKFKFDGKEHSAVDVVKMLAADMQAKGKNGKWIKFGDTEVILLNIPENATPIQLQKAVLALGHELGHSIYNQTLDKALINKNMRQRLQKAFEADKKRVGTVAYEGKYGFEEWFSDQMGTWLIKEMEVGPKGTVSPKAHNAVDSFFKRLAKKIIGVFKQLDQMLQRRFTLNMDFDAYVAELSEAIRDSKAPVSVAQEIEIRDMVDDVANGIHDTHMPKALRIRIKNKAVQTLKMMGELLPTDRRHWGVEYLLLPAHNVLKRVLLRSGLDPAFADMIYSPSQSKAATGTLNGRISLMYMRLNELGKLAPKKKNGEPDIDAWEGTLKQAEDDTLEYGQLSPEAKKVRRFLEDFFKDNIEGKDALIKFRKNFYPRIINMEALLDNQNGERAALAAVIVKHNKMPLEAAEAHVEKMLQENERNPDDPQDTVSEVAIGMAKERSEVFTKIPNKALREIGVLQDPYVALVTYVQDMTKRIDYQERVTVRVTQEDINNAKKLAKETREKNVNLPKGATPLDNPLGFLLRGGQVGQEFNGWQASEVYLNRIADPREQAKARHAVSSMLGKVGGIKSKLGRQLNSALLTVNIVTMLTFAALASLPDLGGTVLRSKDFGAIKTFGQQLGKYFNNREEMRAFARDVGVVSFDSLNTMYLNAAELGFMGDWSKFVSEKFFIATGLEAYTKFTRVFAAGMAEQFLFRKAADNSDIATRHLEELQVTREDIKKWIKNGRSFETAEGEKVRAAIARFVDEAIMRPNSAERPGWASSPQFALVWQLKSFFYAYGKNIIGGALRESNNRYAEDGKLTSAAIPLVLGATALLPLTMLGLEIRELIKYFGRGMDPAVFRSDNMTWPQYTGEVIDRSGSLGAFGLIIPMLDAGKYGGQWWVPPFGPTAERIEKLMNGKAQKKDYLPFYDLGAGQLLGL